MQERLCFHLWGFHVLRRYDFKLLSAGWAEAPVAHKIYISSDLKRKAVWISSARERLIHFPGVFLRAVRFVYDMMMTGCKKNNCETWM